MTEHYFLRITAEGQGTGNNAGFDNLVVTGVLDDAAVPEPASLMLLGAAGLTLLRRRRAA